MGDIDRFCGVGFQTGHSAGGKMGTARGWNLGDFCVLTLVPGLQRLRKAQRKLSVALPTLDLFLWLGHLSMTKSGCRFGTRRLRAPRQVFPLWQSHRHQFCRILLSKTVAGLPESRGQYTQTPSFNGRSIKGFVPCFNPPQSHS